MEHAEHGALADRQAESLDRPRTWPAAQREGFRDDQPSRPYSAQDVRDGDVLQALAEHSAGATRQRTAQAPDAHYKRDRATATGNIAEVPLVMTVDLLGSVPAPWAPRHTLGAGKDDQPAADTHDVVDTDLRCIRKE